MEVTDKWAYALGDEEEYNDIFYDRMKAHPEYQTKFFTIFDSREYKVGEEK